MKYLIGVVILLVVCFVMFFLGFAAGTMAVLHEKMMKEDNENERE